MRKFVFLFINLIWVMQISSQEDSLRTRMAEQILQGDSSLYAETAFKLFQSQSGKGNTKEAVETLREALKFAPEGDTLYYQVKSNFLIQSFSLNGGIRADLPLLDTAIVCIKKINDGSTSVANLHMYTAYSYGIHGNYREAKQHYISALAIWESLPKEYYNQRLKCHTSIMNYEDQFQNHKLALQHARSGMDIIPKADDYSAIIAHYVDNAVILHTLGMDKKSEESNIMAWEIAQNHGSEFEKAYTNSNRALIHIGNKEYEPALQQLKEAKDYYVSIGDKEQVLQTEINRSTILKEQGDTIAWIEIINKRLELCRDSFYPSCRSVFYTVAFEGEGILTNEEQDTLIGEQIIFSQETKDYALVSNAYLFRSNLATARKDYKKSNKYLFEHLAYLDTTKTEQLQSSLAEEKTKQDVEYFEYKTQKAELQSELLQRRNQLFFTILLALGAFLAAGFYFYRKLSASRKKISSQNTQLQELNDTKDRFFSIIAHDLRSPISALDGVGQQMEYYLKKNDIPKLNLLSERVDTTAKNMSGLLDNLLSWALLQKGMISYNPKSINVHDSVEESITLFKEVAQLKGIELYNLVEKSLVVYADEAALATILRNLINNAVKFTDTDGKVTVSAEEKDGRVFIVINDTGTGIGADAIPKLFDVSSRSKKGTKGEKGTGLGLSLCKEMIELNKGSIKVMSEIGVGTAFIFDLPIKV